MPPAPAPDAPGGQATAPAPRAAASPASFRAVRRLGSGAYADVVEAAPLSPAGAPHVALKIVDKRHALRAGAVEALRRERATLDAVRGVGGLAHLLYTFQSDDAVYLALELAPNGELLDQIERAKREAGGGGGGGGGSGLPEDAARAYAAEMVLMLEALRVAGVAHRDVKPENLVLDGGGHLVLADFGAATFADPADPRAPPPPPQASDAASRSLMGRPSPTMLGTADYVPPEAVGGGGGEARGGSDGDDDDDDDPAPAPAPSPPSPYAADVWALGCVTFHMLTGAPPFRGATEYATLTNVAAGAYAWPPSLSVSPAARAFVDACLVADPASRLGVGDVGALRAHPWFDGVDFETLRASPAPPFVPPPVPPPDPDDLDWGLATVGGEEGEEGSPPLRYEFDGGGGGAVAGGGLHAVSAATAEAVVRGEEQGRVQNEKKT